MIFVTVGTQLPFDRLTGAIEAWAGSQPEQVIAQVGPSGLTFKNMTVERFMPADAIDELYAKASVVVAHAGMGSILSALRHGKPIVIVPRKAALGEHRNDHQLATARWMTGRPGVSVALEPLDAVRMLQEGRVELTSSNSLSEFADAAFTSRINKYLLGR